MNLRDVRRSTLVVSWFTINNCFSLIDFNTAIMTA